MPTLFARATRLASRSHFRYVRPVPMSDATGLVATVYQRIEAEFGMLAPPLALHSPAPSHLAAAWMILREVLLAPGVVARRDKEAVAAAVSRANACPYCVEVHGSTLDGLTRGDAASDDPRRTALSDWAMNSAGFPFPQSEAPELLGTALTFHYVNRMVNVFLTDSPLPPVNGVGRRLVRRAAAGMMRRLVRRTELGASGSTDLLPAAPLAADLGWAAERPSIAQALARAVATFDAGGEGRLTPTARRLVGAAISEPGRDAGTAPWLRERLGSLPPADRDVARLALLTAVSSYRVTDTVIADARAAGCDDAGLIEVASWASIAAARQMMRAAGTSG